MVDPCEYCGKRHTSAWCKLRRQVEADARAVARSEPISNSLQSKKPNITCRHCGEFMQPRFSERNPKLLACPHCGNEERRWVDFIDKPYSESGMREADAVRDTTTNRATLTDVVTFEAGQADERARIEPELQRLRKERDDARNEVKAAELRGAMEAEKRIERILEYHGIFDRLDEGEYRDLLAAIREDNDA